MDDDTTPLQPEELDELLSAELDDELEAAERDLGLSAGAAAARLRATPGAAERRAASRISVTVRFVSRADSPSGFIPFSTTALRYDSELS